MVMKRISFWYIIFTSTSAVVAELRVTYESKLRSMTHKTQFSILTRIPCCYSTLKLSSMGLLTEGLALSPEEMKDVSSYIREHGITQFLKTWERIKGIEDDELRFGDEIECGLYVVDSTNKSVKISLRSAELRKLLDEKEALYSHESEGCTWHPEFGAWMIESTPSRPYSNYATDLLRVERNMVLRRRRLLALLGENEIAPTTTAFPLLGAGDFIVDPQPFAAPHSQSQYIPDYIINPHPRFAALTRNIRSRRGEKVNIQVPLFHDIHTPEFSTVASAVAAAGPEVEIDKETRFPPGWKQEENQNIHMDAMGFGMGMCCLQVTFQARDVDESRYMYDQLAVLAPIMLAMTAATPVFKGRLADIDVRWSTIAQSVDDRTPVERGAVTAPADVAAAADDRMSGRGIATIPKSRYDSISTYIYHCKGDTACHRTFAVYNDIPCPIDPLVKERLRNAGLDENLAHHLAHLWCRDPISAFKGLIELDDETSMDHFESLQSTNWQTCRWKPPPLRRTLEDPHIGWRTEFRSMEVQLTDFENAAFTVFVVLINRVMLAFDLSFYIPLSKVDENMERAHKRDAVRQQMFFFRKYIAPPECEEEENGVVAGLEAVQEEGEEEASAKKQSGPSGPSGPCGRKAAAPLRTPCSGKNKYDGPDLSAEDAFEEMTMGEIFNGKGDYFPGLLPLVYAYLEFINCDQTTYNRVNQYMQFIEKRATGQLLTPATWMRKFIQTHPAYQQDSIVHPEICHDLLLTCKGIGEGTIHCPELLGDVTIDRIRKEDAYGQILAGKLSGLEKNQLLKTLAARAQQARPEHVARGKMRSQSLDETHANTNSTATAGLAKSAVVDYADARAR